MDVRMVLELLIPGVKHTEETDIRAEMFRVASDFEQRLGTGAEEQTIDELLVLKRQGGQKVRQREDNVGIARRQEFILPVRQPAFTRVALALWAMPVSARVVRDGSISAGGALVDVATERSRAATLDGGHNFLVARRQPPVATFGEVRPRGADHIGHLDRRPLHLLFRAGLVAGLGW